MKTPKTIRKMHHAPLAREIAKLQRSIHSTQLRCTRLIKFADEIEQEGRTLRRENAELRGKLSAATLPAADTQAELWPELPNGEATTPDPTPDPDTDRTVY
jgi:regulator of replication initiation timing